MTGEVFVDEGLAVGASWTCDADESDEASGSQDASSTAGSDDLLHCALLERFLLLETSSLLLPEGCPEVSALFM